MGLFGMLLIRLFRRFILGQTEAGVCVCFSFWVKSHLTACLGDWRYVPSSSVSYLCLTWTRNGSLYLLFFCGLWLRNSHFSILVGSIFPLSFDFENTLSSVISQIKDCWLSKQHGAAFLSQSLSQSVAFVAYHDVARALS